MKEPSLTPVVGNKGGVGLENEQRGLARAQNDPAVASGYFIETQDRPVKIRGGVEIAHFQAHLADTHRGGALIEEITPGRGGGRKAPTCPAGLVRRCGRQGVLYPALPLRSLVCHPRHAFAPMAAMKRARKSGL